MFFDKKKVIGSILDGFDKYPKERQEKIDYPKESSTPMAKGGEAEEEHMEELAAHSEAMHEAHKKGDHKAHAHALKAFLHAHEAHEESKKDGKVDVEHRTPAIMGDEYD